MALSVIGLDFGTLSVRALLLEAETGRELASRVAEYRHGVLDKTLPDGTPLPDGWALQHPVDYCEALEQCVAGLFAQGADPMEVAAMGLCFTSSTVLPLDKDGTPLSLREEYAKEPHAWCKLWKHHGATAQAERLTRAAQESGQDWLPYYGKKLSGEYLLPKALELLEDAPKVYAACDSMMEAGDWVCSLLCDTPVRSACGAGYKSLWSDGCGYPSPEYLAMVNPDFADFAQTRLNPTPTPVGGVAGRLCGEWARRLGLPSGIPVAVPVIDAHASVPGCGIDGDGQLLMILGTSTCHILLDRERHAIPGVNGVVKDGILPGFYAYEAGQCCVGDSFSWYLDNCLPAEYATAAAREGKSLHHYLRERAELLQPGESGLLALDWFNGVRSTLMDFDLSAMIAGLTIYTTPEEIYRALIEATAYGARQIVEAYREGGIAIRAICATGGIAHKDTMAMQIYADVLGLPIQVAGGGQSGARGSAIYALAALEASRGSHPDLPALAARYGDSGSVTYSPIEQNVTVYQQLFLQYQSLYRLFGSESDLLPTLKRIKSTCKKAQG